MNAINESATATRRLHSMSLCDYLRSLPLVRPEVTVLHNVAARPVKVGLSQDRGNHRIGSLCDARMQGLLTPRGRAPSPRAWNRIGEMVPSVRSDGLVGAGPATVCGLRGCKCEWLIDTGLLLRCTIHHSPHPLGTTRNSDEISHERKLLLRSIGFPPDSHPHPHTSDTYSLERNKGMVHNTVL